MQKSFVSRPKALVCYICGREYGTTSLNIHLKTCKEKWDIEENKKPKNQRRPCPQPPPDFDKIIAKGSNITNSDLEQFNNKAFDKYNEEALVPCVNCGRTFLPDSLIHHQKACKKDNPYKSGVEKNDSPDLKQCPQCKKSFPSERLDKHISVCGQTNQQTTPQKGSASSYQDQSGEKIPVRPKTLICYVCGREFGTKSLGIHIKSCKEKFLNEESKKPKKDRREIPQPPVGLEELLEKSEITMEDIEQYNKVASKKYNVESLVTCPNCTRTFKPEAFEHHKNACKADKPLKPLDRQEQQGGKGEELGEQGELVPCSKCGRNFDSSRVAKHELVCKGDGAAGSKTQPITKSKVDEQKKNLATRNNQEEEKYHAPVRPKTIICYICGREYGTMSIKIHIKSCEQKWEIEEGKKPPKQRRPIPQPPPGFAEISESGGQMNIKAFEEYNNVAFDKYNKEALVPCANCGRTFKPESLEHHKKACTAEKPLKPLHQQAVMTDNQIGQSQQQQPLEEYADEQEGELVPCCKCGRNFNANRVAKHEKICKGPATVKSTRKQVDNNDEEKQVQTVKHEKEKSNWKQAHEDFIQNMKYNKKIAEIEKNGGDIRQLGPPPASIQQKLDSIQCPYCNRSFSEQAAERHIGICKNVINKPKQAPSKPQQQPPSQQSQNIFQMSMSVVGNSKSIVQKQSLQQSTITKKNPGKK